MNLPPLLLSMPAAELVRVALLAVLLLFMVQARVEAAQGGPRRGVASWYGEQYRGRPMANGAPFDPQAMTCAAWDWPLGTQLRVKAGEFCVVVTVTDRGPRRDLWAQGRVIDLSRAAFAKLAPVECGLVPVFVEVVR